MKQKILLIFFCLSIYMLNAQTIMTWDYPVKPGTSEWIALSTHDEKVEVCQIPVGILSTITTEELVELCLNYPIQFDFYAFNSMQEGLIKVANNFNGLQELFRREDSAQYLIDLLIKNDLEVLSNKSLSSSQIGKMIIRQTLIEVMLSHELVIGKTTLLQQNQIAAIGMRDMSLKVEYPQLYSRFSLESSAYLLSANLKNMKNGDALSPNLELFLREGRLQNSMLIEEVKQGYSNIVIR
ncbi:hypothetical protein LJC57_01695 [Parabacteroides sp. OttesenSCG-928-G07]|nr:hypothetical protein [Parabacteroides sp. OttesenSCG-928-G21]MDL2277282.1 hypothetical protein [Parabacteroides sp. OttesenSCG-928-G07]